MGAFRGPVDNTVVSDASNAAFGAVLSLGRVALEGPDGSDSEDADRKAGQVQAGSNDTEKADGRVAALDHAAHGGVTPARVQPLVPLANFCGVHLADEMQVEADGRDVRRAGQEAEGAFACQHPHPELLDGFCPHDEEDEGQCCGCQAEGYPAIHARGSHLGELHVQLPHLPQLRALKGAVSRVQAKGAGAEAAEGGEAGDGGLGSAHADQHQEVNRDFHKLQNACKEQKDGNRRRQKSRLVQTGGERRAPKPYAERTITEIVLLATATEESCFGKKKRQRELSWVHFRSWENYFF